MTEMMTVSEQSVDGALVHPWLGPLLTPPSLSILASFKPIHCDQSQAGDMGADSIEADTRGLKWQSFSQYSAKL